MSAARVLTASCAALWWLARGAAAADYGPKYPPTRGEVWPRPQRELKEQLYYRFYPSEFKVKVSDHTCDLLTKAIARYAAVVGDAAPPGAAGRPGAVLRRLEVALRAPCEDYPHLDMDESYNLTVSSNSTLTSSSIWGILRGLETFAQSFYLSADRSEMRINKTVIFDYPRYAHRGLLLDTARHFISPRNILATLDAMAMNKMNVFHWHIVDDQSFPYRSERFPELSERGAYDPSLVYSADDIRRVIEYARERGIRVLPEFDVPGHTASWGRAYRGVLTECYRGERVVGLGPMDPTKNVTYKLLRDLFGEVQALFPDRHFHIGGDEVELGCWESNPRLREYMKARNLTAAQLHAVFMRNALPLLAAGTTPVVWQEVFDEGVSLPEGALVQVWKYGWVAEMTAVLRARRRVLFSAAWYLDALGAQWADLYAADPRQMVLDATGDARLAAGVLGGEACMWGELVDDRNVQSRVWPRAAGVAERLWSRGASARFADTRAPRDAFGRMEEHACRMLRRGVEAQPPSGPGFCVR